MRIVLNAILWIVRTGSQWRNLDSARFSNYKWQSVYYYYYTWIHDGTWESLNRALNYHERKRVGKLSDPSLTCVDSQSVKLAPLVGACRGFDGNKKINGRKRQIVVDTLGLVWSTTVHAANVFDGIGAIDLVDKMHHFDSRLEKILVDLGYQGKFLEHAQQILSEVIVEFSSKPPSQRGFVPIAKRWIVERSFAWMNFFRRLVIDYERTTKSAESMILIANISMNHPLSVCFGTHNKKQIYCAKHGLKLAINSGNSIPTMNLRCGVPLRTHMVELETVTP